MPVLEMLYKIFRGCVGDGQDICFRRDGKYFSPPSNLAGEKVWKNTEAQKQHFSRQSLQTFPQ
jgi:hypothetical protein